MEVTAISAVVAAAGVIVGVVFAVLELRNITRTRQMQLVMNTYSLFTTRQYMEAWEKLRTRDTGNYEEYVQEHGLADVMQVAALFEGLGFLLHRRFLTVDLVQELMSESTKMAWEKVEPLVDAARKRVGARRPGEYVPVYQWFEYLYHELKAREARLQQS